MATNPYSYGSLGQRWTVGEPTSKSLLDVSRVKADANRWALEQLIVDPDDTANFVLTAPGLNIDSSTLYVDSVNNSVGFGLTNPNDYAFNGTPSWVASGGAGNASVILVSGTTSIGYFAFADGTTGTDRYSGNIQYNHSTNTMSFNTNGGVEAMSIDSSQRVGIGAASPLAVLHTATGTANLSSVTSNTQAIFEHTAAAGSVSRVAIIGGSGSGYSVLDFGDTSGSNNGGITYNHGADSMEFATTNGTTKMHLSSDGKLGIGGSSSPTCRLDLEGAGGGSPTGAVPAGGVFVKVTDTATVGEGAVLRLQATSGAKETSATIAAVHTSGNNGDLTFGLYGGGATHPEGMRLTSAGNLLIGYTSSNGSYKLQVNSQIFATNATIATSDGRYKEEVQTLSNATDLVSRLNPVQFKWKAHEIHNLDVGKTDVGFIAQEVQEVLSDTDYSDSVVVTNKTDDEEYLGLGETKLIPLLTAALQEAITKIETLETKVAALEAA
jgi:hypothetical protein